MDRAVPVGLAGARALDRAESPEALAARRQAMEDAVLAPLQKTGIRYRLLMGSFLLVFAWGMFAWSVQIRRGLAVTGMSTPIPWGFYITNFVFWIGVSHAGTFISAVLRVTNVGWRTPVVRMAEFMTIAALLMGGLMPLVDLGRPDRILNLVLYGRFQSAIVWDLLAVTTYLTGSLIYLYLPLIPDLALARDRLDGGRFPWRVRLYRVLAVGWHGNPEQWRRLSRGIRIMCVLIIGVMVSVHTVVSWIFGMTLRPGWHSTIFGPYFVIGAIWSGIAAVLTGMAVFRRAFRLQSVITRRHFEKLSRLLLVAGLIYAYLTLNEYLTIAYKLEGKDLSLLTALFTGQYAPLFWIYGIAGMLVPLVMLALPWTRNIPGIVTASILVNVGMWIKRFVITVPSLAVPQIPTEWASYSPTWVEVSIVAATFAGFAFLVGLMAKTVPLVPMWELSDEMEAGNE
ncbi:MAG: polysulfide reductase NrfD [Actinobacteria bacterium]|nr:polysulfide reductase NrfD [Actinomycetota bacterium]